MISFEHSVSGAQSSHLWDPATHVVVLVPAFKWFKSHHASTWGALHSAFEGSEWLAGKLPGRVFRSQTRLVATLDGSEQLQALLRVIDKRAADPGPHGTYMDSLRIGISDIERTDRMMLGAGARERLIFAQYLAMQAARLSDRRANKSDLDVARYMEGLRGMRTTWAHENVVDLLFAIPAGGWAAPTKQDPLESWHLSTRHWPRSGFAALTDVQQSRATLRPDLDQVAAQFVSRQAPLHEAQLRAMRIREGHNSLFQKHLARMTSASSLMFAAAGDGAIGFIQDPAMLDQLAIDARLDVEGRLISRIAAIPIGKDKADTLRALDEALGAIVVRGLESDGRHRHRAIG